MAELEFVLISVFIGCTMTFWILTFVLAIIVFVALIYSGRPSPISTHIDTNLDKTEDHFKVRLKEIDTDLKAEKLSLADADDARAELARELMRHRAIASDIHDAPTKRRTSFAISLASFSTIAFAFAGYLLFGTPVAPNHEQVAQTEAEIEFEDAIARVELRTQTNPDDIRAWQVLSSVYVNTGRYENAANAFEKILELAPPTADGLTDLAQALLMIDPVEVDPRAIELLQEAGDLDPAHARSRFFLAVDATRRKDWDNAIAQWNSLLELGSDDEPWVEAARESLGVAMARGEPVEQPSAPFQNPSQGVPAEAPQAEIILSMVTGLAQRLEQDGGTIEEWTQLVRSFLVLNENEKALSFYEKAIIAYPDETQRLELQQLVEEANLL